MPILRDQTDTILADLLAALHHETLAPADPARLVQDLQIHQIELELQNRELREAQRALEESRDRYVNLYDLAPVAYATLSREGRVTQMNLAAAALLGVERGPGLDLFLGTRLTPADARALLRNLGRVLATGEEASLEVGLDRPPAPRRALRLTLRREHPRPSGASPPGCHAILADITELRDLTARLQERQVQLEHLAEHDPLTGLPNRLLFADRLHQAMRHAHRERRKVALLFVDLDHFKTINDRLGHATGDLILQQAARRLRTLVREGDTVARLGGDEFTVILGALTQGSDAALIAHKLIAAFAEPFEVADRSVQVTASIGLSLYPDDGTELAALVCNADAAMYRAKDQGRNTFRFYTEDMTALALAQVALETDLRQALARGQFVLHYQPQLELATGRILGCEALIRWQHPEFGLVEPGRFIPLAEATGLIVPISAWVVRTAAAQIKAWRDQALLTQAAVWVNLSGRDTQDPNLAATIAGICGEVGVHPGCLAVEITETWIMTNPDLAAATIQRLQALGIAVGIDDFGTGYSSLAALTRLGVHEIKIDRSFVARLPQDPDDCAIARAMIALGRALGLRVVAEGVETQAQADFLKAEGCGIGQGYLFSAALPAAQFEVYARGGTPV